MKPNYSLLAVACAVVSVPLAVIMLNRRMPGDSVPVVRIASFNIALNRQEPGQLLDELRGGNSEQARKIAEIVQRNEIDVMLLCELDRDGAATTASVFADEYLAVSQKKG